MPANATILPKRQCVVSVQRVLLISCLLLNTAKQLTTLVGCTHCVHEVVKFANHPKLAKLLELIERSSRSKLLFPFTNSLPVYCSLNDKVDDMARTAYAVIGGDINVWVEVEALDKLAVVTRRVIAHKAVKFRGDIVAIDSVEYDLRLGSSSMVSI
jgi:hypothetical protein